MSESQVAEAVIDFCNALEAAVVNLRRQLTRQNGQPQQWNPNLIKWESKQGSKGHYERSEDVNNPHFKLMLKDLASHQGKLTRNGLFYWVFQNGITVGRTKAKFDNQKHKRR
jgi:hypothetical protein